MQFSLVALVAVVAGVAMATPMSLHQIRACDTTACAIALGPTAFSCIGAAAAVGTSPIADVGCLAGVLNYVVNAPAACAGCGSAINSTVAGEESTVGNAVTDFTSAISAML